MHGTPEQHATGYYVKMGDYRGRRGVMVRGAFTVCLMGEW